MARYRRLLSQIDEEVLALKDHLEALEEVKMSRFESSISSTHDSTERRIILEHNLGR